MAVGWKARQASAGAPPCTNQRRHKSVNRCRNLWAKRLLVLGLICAGSPVFTACGGKPIAPGRLFVRWTTTGVVWGDLDEDARGRAWCLERGTSSRTDGLTRFGPSVDGALMCVVRDGASLEVRRLGASTQAYAESVQLAEPNVQLTLDGCLADVRGNVLAFSTYQNLIVPLQREAESECRRSSLLLWARRLRTRGGGGWCQF